MKRALCTLIAAMGVAAASLGLEATEARPGGAHGPAWAAEIGRASPSGVAQLCCEDEGCTLYTAGCDAQEQWRCTCGEALIVDDGRVHCLAADDCSLAVGPRVE